MQKSETNRANLGNPQEDEMYNSILRKYWGYEGFRGVQLDIIRSVGEGRDTLGLMPTGGGKSITFQVPALAKPGICIVITPLVALMKDQVLGLKKRKIKAAAIHSGLSHEEMLAVLDNAVFSGYKFLYISPERLSSELFIAKLKHMDVNLITVDEAHCICQWGYDFRPSYLQIAVIRKVKPEVPVLALTATATPEVVKDIQRALSFRQENVFRMSFFRSNLSYTVYYADSRMTGMLHILKSVPGCSIIYTRNRQHCQDLSAQLNEMGFSSTYYHAGLPHSQKDAHQQFWLRNECRIMVATNAFGMGIDKPDVRLVIHIDLPDSIEEYFQEAGRAGRDGGKSFSVIVMDGKEMEMSRRRPAQKYPPIEFIQNVYEKICFYFELAVGDGLNVIREFNVQRFCHAFHFHPLSLRSSLDLLDAAGYIAFRDEEDGCSRIRIKATRGELWKALSQDGIKLFTSLFRHYGGIFVEYVYLEEELICQDSGLTMEYIYQTLVELTRSGLVSYIPRRKVPKITFLQRRVETKDLILPRSVYKERKEAYEFRLRALQEYCINTSDCRSRLLLRYFGEKDSHDCGVCDVCEAEKPLEMEEEEFRSIRRYIINQLHQQPKKMSSLEFCGINQHKLTWVLDYMRAKEEIRIKDFMIELTSSDLA